MINDRLSWLEEKNLLYPNWVKWIIQILYWSLHFSINIGLYTAIDGNDFPNVVTWSIVTLGSTLLIFYSYFYYIIPKFLGKNNLKFFLITISVIILYPTLKYLLDQQLGLESLRTLQLNVNEDSSEAYILGEEIGRRLFTLLWNIPFALFARFMVDWFKNKRIKSIMETQQLKSELALLRNQVNPHFLFNVLNNIDAMVYPHSEEASNAIMKLSSIMRYMLYESDTDLVKIEKEIDYLKAYVDLQRMRLKPTDQINFEINQLIPDVRIAPMILIPFVENAFKHASRIDDRLNIQISLTFDDDATQFQITNSFDPNAEEQKDETGGIGLSNVHKRLDLIYPGKHQLKIEAQDSAYVVNLEITPNKS